MKINLITQIISILLVLFTLGCTKDAPNQGGQNPFYVPGGTITDTTSPTPITGLPVGAVPLTFTKKVILEENTGEWCGWCPEGAKIMEDAINANPNKVIGVAVHDGDPMEVAAYNSWHKSFTGVSGFPNGNVNRRAAAGRGTWMGSINSDLLLPTDLGLALITKETGGILSVDVYVGYNSPITLNTNISLVITEDDVPQSSPGAQSNYSSTVTVGPGWTHGHVFRGVVTLNEGNPIVLNSNEKYTKITFNNIDLNTMKIGNLSKTHVVAYINVNTGAPTPNGKTVLNVQTCSLNEIKNWD